MATLLPFAARKHGADESYRSSAATSSAALSDVELCARASARGGDGDRDLDDARSEIFIRHKHGVARTLAAVLGPEPECEDLVHETFLRAFPRLAEIESAARLSSWLRAIAVFVAREWLRKKARRRWSLFAEPPEIAAPETAEEVRDAVRDTFAILAKMPVDERFAFSLRYVEGLEIEELAVAMDLSVSTVKRRLRDAERRFRKLAARHESLREYLEVTP